jgi:hypothetical protein
MNTAYHQQTCQQTIYHICLCVIDQLFWIHYLATTC